MCGLDMDNASLSKAEEGYEYFESVSNGEIYKRFRIFFAFPDDSIVNSLFRGFRHLHQILMQLKRFTV